MSCPWSQTIDSGVPGRDERNSSHARVGVATSDVDERSRDLTDQVLELGRRSRSLVWGDVILALSASFVRRACPAHRAEEPVIGTI